MNRRALILAALSCGLTATAQTVDKAKVMGSLSAPLLMEIYSSFDCPHCRELHEVTIMPSVVPNYVITGKLCIVNREFPLSGAGHPYSREAANLATAAARIGKYEQVADALFRNQGIWGLNGKVWETVASVLSPTEQAKVQALAKAPDVVAEVQRDYDAGLAAGLTATPLMVISKAGKHLPPVTGFQPYQLLHLLLDQYLAK
jgi:protein-disulfide isomerase